MELATKFSDNFSTEKAISFIEMDKAEITIPRTILINNEDIVNIDSFLDCINSLNQLSYQRCSVRLSFSNVEYPHCIRDVAEKHTINMIIKNLINKAREYNINCYDIIFQPLIENITWSGAIIKKSTSIFVEMVYGAGKTIFRDGQYAYRYLCTQFSEFETLGDQILYANWNNGNLTESILDQKCLSQNILRNTVKSIQYKKLANNKLYEFAIVNNDVFFLDCKNIVENSYDNLDKLFIDEEYTVLDSQKNYGNISVFDAPLFEHIKGLTDRSSVYVNGGAILSHMPFYCIKKNISCKFKTSLEKVKHAKNNF